MRLQINLPSRPGPAEPAGQLNLPATTCWGRSAARRARHLSFTESGFTLVGVERACWGRYCAWTAARSSDASPHGARARLLPRAQASPPPDGLAAARELGSVVASRRLGNGHAGRMRCRCAPRAGVSLPRATWSAWPAAPGPVRQDRGSQLPAGLESALLPSQCSRRRRARRLPGPAQPGVGSRGRHPVCARPPGPSRAPAQCDRRGSGARRGLWRCPPRASPPTSTWPASMPTWGDLLGRLSDIAGRHGCGTAGPGATRRDSRNFLPTHACTARARDLSRGRSAPAWHRGWWIHDGRSGAPTWRPELLGYVGTVNRLATAPVGFARLCRPDPGRQFRRRRGTPGTGRPANIPALDIVVDELSSCVASAWGGWNRSRQPGGLPPAAVCGVAANRST